MYSERQNTTRGEQIPSLEHYHGMHYQLERDIQDNNRQIKQLNNKNSKSEYDHTQILKLEQKQQALIAKQRELEDIIRNQEYIHREMINNKTNEKQFKHSLATEYTQIQDEKRRRAEEERRRVIQQEKVMHDYNRKALEEEQIRRKMAVEEQKRAALEQLALKEQAKLKQRELREKEKEEYNTKMQLRSQLQTQKDSVYKQYYNQFMENQQTLHHIYKNKAAVSDREREMQRAEFQKREIEDYHQRVAREQQERVHRMNADKDMLRSFLQNQIEEKQRKKSRDREEELDYQSQVYRYQVGAAQAQQSERMRRKQQQRRYDEQLKQQTRTKSYSQNYSPSSPHQLHNPITNPIDFKIGITNPYVIREYELAKQKYVGDANLKLRNLAMVGSTSLSSK